MMDRLRIAGLQKLRSCRIFLSRCRITVSFCFFIAGSLQLRFIDSVYVYEIDDRFVC